MINIQAYNTLSSPGKKGAMAETERYLDSCLLLFCFVFECLLQFSQLQSMENKLVNMPQTCVPNTGTISWKGHNIFYQGLIFLVFGYLEFECEICVHVQVRWAATYLFYFMSLLCFVSFLCSVLCWFFCFSTHFSCSCLNDVKQVEIWRCIK